MRKRIYKGCSEGLYDISPFRKFIENIEGSDLIVENTESSGYKIFIITHIDPHNVTLLYLNHNDGGLASFDKVETTLYGTKEGIGEVEKIVLEAAKNFKKN